MPCYEVGPMDGWMDGWMEWQEVAGDGDHKSFVEEKGMPKALLFTCVPCLQHPCSTRSTVGEELKLSIHASTRRDKKETPPTFKALSLRFKDRMRLGQASDP